MQHSVSRARHRPLDIRYHPVDPVIVRDKHIAKVFTRNQIHNALDPSELLVVIGKTVDDPIVVRPEVSFQSIADENSLAVPARRQNLARCLLTVPLKPARTPCRGALVPNLAQLPKENAGLE